MMAIGYQTITTSNDLQQNRCAWCNGSNTRNSPTCSHACAKSWRRVGKKRGRLFAVLPAGDAHGQHKDTTSESVSVASVIARLEAQIAELERIVALNDRIKTMKKQLGLFGENT